MSNFFGINDDSVTTVRTYCEHYAGGGVAFQNDWSDESHVRVARK
jgi:hypothetical protein